MVGDIASANRPDDFSRFEKPLHSPAQASYWVCAESDARKVHGLLGFDWARLEEECGQPRRKLSRIQVGAVTIKVRRMEQH